MENLPPSYPPPLPPDPTRLRVGAVIRDVAILWGLTLAGGFVLGFCYAATHSSAPPPTALVALSNFGLGLVAFTLSGSLAPAAVRWKHLAVVALFSWLTSVVNVFFFHVAITIWVFSAAFIALLMVLGGALSYLFNRDPGPTV